MLTSLFARAVEALDSTYNPSQWLIDWVNGGEPTASGEHINEESAMRIPAVHAAVTILAETMQVLPLQVYQIGKGGSRSLVHDHPVAALFNTQPNAETNAAAWSNKTERDACLFGNAYSVIQRTGRGDAIALWQREAKPERTKLLRDPETKKLYYACRDSAGADEPNVDPADMFHVRFNSPNALAGKSPVTQLKEAIAGNKAAERYANELFAHGAAVQGHYTVPGKLTEPAYQRLRQSMENYGSHGMRHKRMLLEEGMTFAEASVDASSTQMIEARNFMLTEVARIWRIDPSLLFVLTYGGKAASELFRQFIILTMLPWCNLWENEIQVKLLKPGFTCEFDSTYFLKGDPAALSAWYRTMFSIGVYSLNEIRREESMNPLTDSNADEHFVPRNMLPLSKASDPDWVLGKVGADGVTPAPGAVHPGDGITPAEPGTPTAPEARAENQTSDISSEIVAAPPPLALLAAEQVVDETLARFARNAAAEATRAAKDPAKFLARMDDFWTRQEKLVREAVTLPLRTVILLRDGSDALDVSELDSIIADQVHFRRGLLVDAAACPQVELSSRVLNCIASWSNAV